jgi:hypothetical protein
MGISDPDVRKKLTEGRYLQYKHLSEREKWSWWKRLFHRFQRCPICRPEKDKKFNKCGQAYLSTKRFVNCRIAA